MRKPNTDGSKNSAGDLGVGVRKQALVFVIAYIFLVAACGSRGDNTFLVAPDKGVTAEDISANPNDRIGTQVTVVAPVKSTFGEQVFLLHTEYPLDALLAVGADPYPDQPNEAIETGMMQAKGVRVTGVVRRFDPAAIEREAGVKLDDHRLAAYIGKPVIVVKSLKMVD